MGNGRGLDRPAVVSVSTLNLLLSVEWSGASHSTATASWTCLRRGRVEFIGRGSASSVRYRRAAPAVRCGFVARRRNEMFGCVRGLGRAADAAADCRRLVRGCGFRWRPGVVEAAPTCPSSHGSGSKPVPAARTPASAIGPGPRSDRWMTPAPGAAACLAARYRADRSGLHPCERPADTPLCDWSGWPVGDREFPPNATGEVGLDQYQVCRLDSWYRRITRAMLTHALPTVTHAAVGAKRHATPGQRANPAHRPRGPPPDLPHHLDTHDNHDDVLSWSHWRRRHQARAGRCHFASKRTALRRPDQPPTTGTRTFSGEAPYRARRTFLASQSGHLTVYTSVDRI
jgi:hypothetical protein